MQWWVPILVAVITGPVVVLLQRLRTENTSQHAESRSLLNHMVIKIDKIDDAVTELKEDLDEHKKDGHRYDVI